MDTAYIIILNWNGYADTIECVNSCLNLDYPSFAIIVVDNCSSDGSEALIRRTFPQIVVLQSGGNLGYAGGNNVGIKYALERGAEYVWLLNNDTVVEPRALTTLVQALQNLPTAGMAGSKILFYADRSIINYAGGVIDPDLGSSEHIGIYQRDCYQFNEVSETGYITGCSLLTKCSVIEQIGLMYEGYFLYFEESEWCIKARRHGFSLLYVPDSIVYHKESASTRKIGGAVTYYMARNRLYFIARNANRANWITRFRIDLVSLLKHIYKKEFTMARSILVAYAHWLTGYAGCRSCVGKIKEM